nr:RNA-binding protein [Lachnospiraceae bacterium]HJC80688.1 RNA-binding protein [Candidatus Mediterraneibacter excrementipullorum]
MQDTNNEKDSLLLEKRFVELSRTAYQRDIITYSDFLNLNEQNILHTLPKDKLFTRTVSFGGYATAERQMAAFIPDALYLRWGKKNAVPEDIDYPFHVLKIAPLNKKFAEELSHRDYLGAVLNLGIERSKTGDILVDGNNALIFVHRDMTEVILRELTRVRHTSVRVDEIPVSEISYEPACEEIRGTVASVRLDSLLALAFSSSRTRLTGLIEGAKVYVNGRLVTSNGYQPAEGDIVSVRGMGKFRFESSGSRTRKNRITVVICKYV